MRTPWTLALLVPIVGCSYSAYDPGSLLRASTLDAPAASIGCLDVGIAPTTDPSVPVEHPALRLDVGNSCPHATPVNLGAMVATGLYDTGWVPLQLRDPRGEVRLATLDGHALIHEIFEFEPLVPRDRPPSTVCVVLDDITTPSAMPVRVRRCVAIQMPEAGDPV